MRGWKRLQLGVEYNMTDTHALADGFSIVEFQPKSKKGIK